MKKFVIISIVLLLLAAGVFGFAMFRFGKETGLWENKKTAETVEATEASDAPVKTTPKAKTPASNQDTAPTGSDVFAEGTAKAQTYIAGMTTEQMVGQLIVGICDDTSTAAAQVNQYNLSGMLFESSNFQGMSPEEITAALKAISTESTIKPILAAQEEGGSYTTISDLYGYEQYDFSSPRDEYDQNGLQGLQRAETEKTTMLKEAGFNMNLGPVVDVVPQADQIMYSRAVSGEVDTVSSYAEYAAKFNQAKGVSAVLKHFPGYGTIPDGSVNENGVTVDDRPADTIRATDYLPFRKGAAAGAHCIMVSNVLVQNLDANHTAALSPAVHTELRNTVGFKGVIMTDVLDESDYSAYSDGNTPAVQAVIAGNDLILVRDYASAYNEILAAVSAGKITETQLKDACTRVLAYKYTAGIMK